MVQELQQNQQKWGFPGLKFLYFLSFNYFLIKLLLISCYTPITSYYYVESKYLLIKERFTSPGYADDD
jgi:hypothetical protein